MTSSYHLEDKEKNVPKLRFKGYNDEWKKVKLKEICSDFIVPMRDKPKEFNGNIPWCRIEDIEGNYFNGTKSNQYVSQKTIAEMNLKIIPTGSVICSCSASLGTYAINTCPIITNQTFIGLVCSEEISNHFLLNLMNTQTKKLKIIAGGTTIPYISREKFEEYYIKIPSKGEQEKIASFLTLIDKKIEKQKELVELLKKYKRGLLSQIFSQKLRFKDDSGNWQKIKLDKLGYFLGGGTPSRNNAEYWTGDIPWISSSDILENDIVNINVSRFITKNAVDNSATKICPNDTICIVSRVGVGKLAISKECVCTSQDFVNFINTTNNNTFYIAYSLKEIMKEKVLKTQGTSIKGITSSEIKNIQIALPTIEIQNKVAFISSYIDSLLNKHENLYKFMLQYKKGLLQQMFI